MAAVEQLEHARDASADASLLHALLEAWRIAQFPVLAELIPIAAQRAVARQRPIAMPERRFQLDVLWSNVAELRDPVSLDWLLEHLVSASNSVASKENIKALEGWPVDPRIAIRLLEIARTKPLTTRRPFWTQLFAIVEQQLHAGVAPLVAELAQTARVTEFDQVFLRRMRKLRDRVALLRPPAPSPVEAQLLEAIAARLELSSRRAATKTADEFLLDIWQHADDDGPREVFADWLLERADPWGELITLQLSRWRKGPAARKLPRERALLEEHSKKWLGPLEPVVVTSLMRFERGFLFGCRVHWRRLAAAPALMTHPAWATVREYELDAYGEQRCEAWLDHMIAHGAKRR